MTDEDQLGKPDTIELGISDVIRPSGGFMDGADRLVVPGDRVQYRFKPKIIGTVGDIMCDGDADVSFDDGTFDTVKWRNLAKWIDT